MANILNGQISGTERRNEQSVVDQLIKSWNETRLAFKKASDEQIQSSRGGSNTTSTSTQYGYRNTANAQTASTSANANPTTPTNDPNESSDVSRLRLYKHRRVLLCLIDVILCSSHDEVRRRNVTIQQTV